MIGAVSENGDVFHQPRPVEIIAAVKNGSCQRDADTSENLPDNVIESCGRRQHVFFDC